MKIILLRHEDRPESAAFLTSLTATGRANASKLANELADVDLVFASPFLRTVQTIYPYCLRRGKKINIENALYEFIEEQTTIRTPALYQTSHAHLHTVIQDKYTSFVTRLSAPWTLKSLYDRIAPFMDHLVQTHNDKCVLLVTHRTTLCMIRHYLVAGVFDGAADDPSMPMGYLEAIQL